MPPSREPSPPRLTSRTSASLPHKTAPFIADMDKLTKALVSYLGGREGEGGGALRGLIAALM